MPTFVIDSLKSVLLRFVIELLLLVIVWYVLQGYSEILFCFSFFHQGYSEILVFYSRLF